MSFANQEKFFVGVIALHSLVLGAALLLFPATILGLVRWPYDCSSFFPAQSGLFLMLLGGAYVAGIFHRQFCWFLVATKVVAAVFLTVEVFLGNCPPITLLQGGIDGLMGVAVATLLLRPRLAKA